MKIFFLSVLLIGCLSTTAQISPFSLASVPDSLKNKATFITHISNSELEIESLEKATLKVHKIFTVLSEEGKGALLFQQHTDRAIVLEDAEVKVYDKNGKQISKSRKKDFTTMAVGDGFVEDGYVTFYNISAVAYPVTVEFNYTVKFKTTLALPDYRYVRPGEAVIQSTFTAKAPADIGLRYKSRNNTLSPVITDEGNYKVYKWAVKHLAPIENEPGSVSPRNKFPQVSIVTDQFSHYGYKGDLSSWKSFGNWINELAKGLDELPEEKQQFFQQLVKDAPDETEKIKRIYDYLQQNFRYVSIQLGIGGLKPFAASFTDQKKYGDCKGLSNYMRAALKSVGIPSYVAVINAEYNEEPVDPEFPSNDFNHMILCVPRVKDSIWLECTSSTAEFGKLGTFTENRLALLVTENGGVLVPTPKSEAATNHFTTRTVVKIDSDLSAYAETAMISKGSYSEMLNSVLKEKRDDQKEFLVSYMGFKQPDDFELNANGSQQVDLKMTIRKVYEFNAGSKYFLNPRINKIWSVKLPAAENRKQDFYFRFPFERKDTTILQLPPNLKPDVLPKETELKTEHTLYKAKTWFNEKENSIYTATTLILKKHKIPAAEYSRFKSFFDDVLKDDAQRLVTQKTENTNSEKKTF